MDLLDPRWRDHFDKVQDLADRVVALLKGLDASADAVRRAEEARRGLDELFLLVLAGEFNAGKSALINALLGQAYLEEGVTPTTQSIQLVTHGDEEASDLRDGTWHRAVPAPLLKDLHIVDTPGTNAILREHEALTKDFIPRADLVLFATSADRPFTESERAFLEIIRDWGKKVVFVINKIDLLESDTARQEVIDFVRQGARGVVGGEPIVFPVSARQALRAKTAGEPAPSDWEAFETWLWSALASDERLRLKLETPLGVVEHLAARLDDDATTRLAVLDLDRAALDHVTDALEVFRRDMEASFDHRLDTIDVLIGRMRERGEEFLDDRFRIRRWRELWSSERLQRDFEAEVIADTPDAIEAEVSGLVDWMIDKEHAQWLAVRERLLDRAESDALRGAARGDNSGFAARRSALLASVGARAELVVERFDSKAESLRLVNQVREALAGTAVAEIGALGMGLILKAILTSAAADATGILAAGVVAMLGFTIIPHRRRQAVAALRDRTAKLRLELRDALHLAFHTEQNAAAERMLGTVEPYGRFVRAEHERLTSTRAALERVRHEARDLRQALGS
jgi:small GTP-binding protein